MLYFIIFTTSNSVQVVDMFRFECITAMMGFLVYRKWNNSLATAVRGLKRAF